MNWDLHLKINEMEIDNVYKSGRAFNGAHRDAGTIIHAIKKRTDYIGGDWFDKSLCGIEPGIRGNGWAKTTRDINCPKCIKKL